jgi:hypothetical protein
MFIKYVHIYNISSIYTIAKRYTGLVFSIFRVIKLLKNDIRSIYGVYRFFDNI